MTNADKIRAMTDEELANIIDCRLIGIKDCNKPSCLSCKYRWLKEEVKDETNNFKS